MGVGTKLIVIPLFQQPVTQMFGGGAGNTIGYGERLRPRSSRATTPIWRRRIRDHDVTGTIGRSNLESVAVPRNQIRQTGVRDSRHL